jgi:surface protein
VCCASLRLCRYGLFSNKPSFNDDISDWNVASVSTMFYVFHSATAFNQDISSWNIASVSTMDEV